MSDSKFFIAEKNFKPCKKQLTLKKYPSLILKVGSILSFCLDKIITPGNFGPVFKGINPPCAIKAAKKDDQEQLLNTDFFLRYLHKDPEASSWITNRIGLKLDPSKTRLWLATELLETSLERHLQKNPNGLPLSDVTKIAEKVVRALSFLNSKDIIYIDLCPSNILLSQNGETVKLGNFRNACFKEPPCQPSLNNIELDNRYACPKVLQGIELTTETPIWNLAQIIVEMFTKLSCPSQIEQDVLDFYKDHYPKDCLRPDYPKNVFQNLFDGIFNAFSSKKNIPLQFDELIKQTSEKNKDGKKTEDLIGLLYKMLAYTKRISAEEILEHSFFEESPISKPSVDIPEKMPLPNLQFFRLNSGSKLGKGYFGSVYKYDLFQDGIFLKRVAVKINNHSPNDILIEDRFLRLLSQDPKSRSFIVNREMIKNTVNKNRIALILEILEKNLYDYSTKFGGLPLNKIRNFTKQLLEALDFLSENEILHLDIKPQNILVSQDEQTVKLADFGSAYFQDVPLQNFTYQITRFYRPPEVVLEAPITTASDLWSLGASLVTALTGSDLFTASNEQNLIQFHQECLEKKYPQELLDQGSNKKKTLYEESLNLEKIGLPSLDLFIKRYYPKRPRISQVESFIDFIKQALEMDPKKRPSPKELLTHPFITS